MKKNLFWLLLSPIILQSQSAKIVSNNCYGGIFSELCNDVSEGLAGSFWLAGFSAGADADVTGNNGSNDFWVCNVNDAGTILSQDNLGGSGDDFAESIELLEDSGRIILGTTYSGDGDVVGFKGSSDFWLVRLKKNGSFKWRYTFGGSWYDEARQLSTLGNYAYYCAGRTNSKNLQVSGKHKFFDAWVIKVNSSGVLLWQKCIGGSGDDEANSIFTTSDNGCVIAGSADKNGGDISGWHGAKDFLVAKLDSLGTLQWSKVFGGSGDDIAYAVKQTTDGGYIVCGYTNSFNGDVVGGKGYGDVWVIKLDSDGNLIWQKVFGGNVGEEQARDILQTTDGGYIIAAYLDGSLNTLLGSDFTTYHNYYDFWIIKTDPEGEIEWNGVYGGPTNDIAYALLMKDEAYYVAGYAGINGCDVNDSNGALAGFGDFWLLGLGDAGCYKPDDLNSSTAFGYATMSWCQTAGAINYELKVRPAAGSFTTYTFTSGNETSKSISVAPLTTYQWKVRAICSAGSSPFTTLQSFTTPARIGEETNLSEILISPIPSSNFIAVHLMMAELPPEIIVSNVTGQIIQVLRPTENEFTVDITNFANGIYFLTCMNNEKKISLPFIKN